MDFQSFAKAWKWQVVYSFLLFSWGWVSGQLRYSVLEESDPGTVVGDIAQDLGLNLVDISKRRLHLGSEESRRHFSLTQETGALTVEERIDRDILCASSSSCSIHTDIIAEKPLEFFSLEVEILDINDNSPFFLNTNYTINITEIFSSVGTRFSLDAAHDYDVGINGITQYKLTSNPYFSLSVKNRKDGTLVPELVQEKALDREEKAEHTLIITALDGGEKPRSGSCLITITVLDINDNAPVFEQSHYKIHLMENHYMNTFIIRLNATDADDGPNGEIEYFFGPHTLSSIKELFSLNTQTGEMYTNGILDFEESKFYELVIKAKDKGLPALVGQCLLQIEVDDANDNPPEIFFTSVTNELPENAALGTVIGFLTVKDKDSGKNGEVQVELSPYIPFEIKTIKKRYSLVTRGLLDREKNSQYNIQLIATDLGFPPLSTQTKITLNISDINDNPPVFPQSFYNAFIKENNEPGSLLCTVSAFDIDEGINAELKYSVINSQIDGTSISSFVYINPNNGNLYAQRSFDYEYIQVLTIVVMVEDLGFPKLFSNVTVFIFVLDLNDNPPMVLYPKLSSELVANEKIPRSASAGYLVTKVSAVDFDSGHNAWLNFSLIRESEFSMFHISTNIGEIRTTRSLQEVENSEQILVVSVSDHGNPSLSTTVTIHVNIVDNIIQESSKSNNVLAKSKSTSDLTLYLVISLVAISLVSLITFVILLLKCLKKENEDNSNCCFPNGTHSKPFTEQAQPTLYMNTDGTLKYMEVRMVPPDMQNYQSCLRPVPMTNNSMKPIDFSRSKDMANEMDTCSDVSWLNYTNQVQ